MQDRVTLRGFLFHPRTHALHPRAPSGWHHLAFVQNGASSAPNCSVAVWVDGARPAGGLWSSNSSAAALHRPSCALLLTEPIVSIGAFACCLQTRAGQGLRDAGWCANVVPVLCWHARTPMCC